MTDIRTVLGVCILVLSSAVAFVGAYMLHGLNFEKYLMFGVIIGLVTFLVPIVGWGIGVHTIASAQQQS